MFAGLVWDVHSGALGGTIDAAGVVRGRGVVLTGVGRDLGVAVAGLVTSGVTITSGRLAPAGSAGTSGEDGSF